MAEFSFQIQSLVLRLTPLDRQAPLSIAVETLREDYVNRNVEIRLLDATLEMAARVACRFAQAIALVPVHPDVSVWSVLLRQWNGAGRSPIVAIGTRSAGIEIIHGEGLTRFGQGSIYEYPLFAVQRYTHGGMR